MAIEWHYARKGKRLGLVTEIELKNLAAQGKLLPTDSVWSEGMAEWVLAGTVKELHFSKRKRRSTPESPVATTTTTSQVVATNPESPDAATTTASQIVTITPVAPVDGTPGTAPKPNWIGNKRKTIAISLFSVGIVVVCGALNWNFGRPTPNKRPAQQAASPESKQDGKPDDTGHADAVENVANSPEPEVVADVAERKTDAPANAPDLEEGWTRVSTSDFAKARGPDATDVRFANDTESMTASLTIGGQEFFKLPIKDKWSVIAFDLSSDNSVAELYASLNGDELNLGEHALVGEWNPVVIVNFPSEKRLAFTVNSVAQSVPTANSVPDRVEFKIASRTTMAGTLEVRNLRICNAPIPPRQFVAAMRLAPERPTTKPDPVAKQTTASTEPTTAAPARSANSIPRSFQNYFERADQARVRQLAAIQAEIHDLEIAINGERDVSRKSAIKASLVRKKESLADLKRSKPYVSFSGPPQIGDMGTLFAATITVVLDSRSAIVKSAEKLYFHLTEIDAKSFKVGDTIENQDCWEVLAVGPQSDDIRRRTRGQVAVVKPIRKADLEKYRLAYESAKKPNERIVKYEPVSDVTIPAEIREYFNRAIIEQKELANSFEKRIKELQALINDINTLPLDKAKFTAEMTRERALLAKLWNSNPYAIFPILPKKGVVGVIRLGTVVKKHDDTSVIVKTSIGPAVRIANIDPKSLEMRTGRTIDGEELWTVVGFDEDPDDEIQSLVRAVRLIVVNPIDKADVVRYRAAFDAERKAAAAAEAAAAAAAAETAPPGSPPKSTE